MPLIDEPGPIPECREKIFWHNPLNVDKLAFYVIEGLENIETPFIMGGRFV